MAHPEIIQRRRNAATLALLVLGGLAFLAGLLWLPETGPREAGRAMQERLAARAAAARTVRRATDPLAWAIAQARHGEALKVSAEMHGRNPDTAGEAVAAYRRALEVLTFGQRPHLWSLAQLNLGDALVMRGAGLRDEAALIAAEAAYAAAERGFLRRHNVVLADAARTGRETALRERRLLLAGD